MKTPQQTPKQQEKLSDAAPDKDSIGLLFYAHAAWFFAALSGLMGFLPDGILFLPVFVYCNAIHVAKSCLSYNKTMILTLMCLFPTAVAVIYVDPKFNGDITRVIIHMFLLCCFSFYISQLCYELRLAELRKRLSVDEQLKELIHHETMFIKDCVVCLGTANAAAFLGLFCYFGAVWPLDKVPLEPRETFLKIYVSLILVGLVLVTLYYAARTFKNVLKIRSLKAATKVVKEAKVLV